MENNVQMCSGHPGDSAAGAAPDERWPGGGREPVQDPGREIQASTGRVGSKLWQDIATFEFQFLHNRKIFSS